MKRTSWLKGMKVGAALVPVLVGLAYLTAVQAQLTTAITVNVNYPIQSIGNNTIGGSSVQQVFQLGSSTAAGQFAGLNPQTGTCPGGGAPVFLKGNAAAIGATNYVYTAQVTNSAQSNVQLNTLTQSLCPTHAPLTSIGYCPGNDNPESANEQVSGLDFNFGSLTPAAPGLIPGQTSSILFFTSPEPPRLESTGIGGGGITSQGAGTIPPTAQPFVGPCPATMTLSKEIACGSASGPFTEGPIQALNGQPIYYRLTVTNTGGSQLSNIVVSDPNLGGNLTSQFTFPNPPGGTSLNPGQSIQRVFGPFTATNGTPVPGTSVNGVNTATVTAALAVAGQTITLNATDNVTLNVVNPQITCDKTVNGGKNVSGYTPGTQLTYVLTATSAASSGANVDLTLNDPTLSALPGVSCNSPLPTTFSNVAPGQSRSITCTVSFASEAAFQAAAGGGSTLNNTLTVTAVVTPGQPNICGGAPGGPALNCLSTASVQLLPPPPPEVCIPGQDNPNLPLGPGAAYPATSEVSDQKAGSILFYNLYTSNGSNPTTQNTVISITNTAPGAGVFVHLFFVSENCDVADAFICLSQNQTSRFLASDLDPGTTGYIVAVAVDGQGCPTNFNFLIGDSYVKLASGHSANLGAEAFAAVAAAPAVCDGSSVTTELRLDGVNYNRAPRVLASSNIQSSLSGNNTLLVLNRVGGNLATGAATLGNIFGAFYDDAENLYSFTFNANVCQFRSSISNTFPRTTPRVDVFIPAGRSGWLKLYSQNDIGILGAQITANSNAGTQAGAFAGGHNLHKLTLTSSAVLTVPIFPPTGGR